MIGTNDIRDIKPDVAIPLPWWVWAIAAAVIVLVAVAAWLIWRKKKLEAESRPVPRKNAVEEARERLQLARQLMLAGEVEAFYVAVSDTIRHYLERQFRLRAAEQTTEEFLQDMARSPRMLPSHKELLAEFLSHCDLVKFARYRPGPAEMEATFASANRFVDETVPRETLALEGAGAK
ncbi:MAG: DUF4381 family protein [Verrucomicrobia bacterium]|nr:DUF4381 family protein [Verrucomicrobiota bacterium]